MFLSRVIQRGARRNLPRRKDQDPEADLQGENAHVRSLLGLGLVASWIVILVRRKVPSEVPMHRAVTFPRSGQTSTDWRQTFV